MRTLIAASTVAAALVLVACPKPDAPPPVGAASPAGPAGASSQPTGTTADAAAAAAAAAHDEHEKKASVDRETVDADGVVRRGTPLTPDLEVTPVSVAVTKAKELSGKKVKLTGKVSDVCSKAGCWFVVAGEKPEDIIRISTKAHNIFVPKSSVGMTAVVEGTLEAKVLDQKTAQHFEDERTLKPGETKKTITGDVTELNIDVTGLELKKS